MDNIWKPRGALKSQKPDAGGAVLRNYPMLGIVKDNVDPTKSGRIRVYISALGAPDPDDEKNWTPVLYMSPYFGLTDTSGGNKDYGSFKANPASYGMWASPPDVGTVVICLFINGDPNFGFYIGSIPDAEAMRMVPAIGANFSTEDVIFNDNEAEKYGGATRLPVTNMNTNNSNETDNPTFIDSPKPVHSFQASIMFQQGVLRDPVRGPISSSAQRESPSRVGWGVSTPGRPIYEGGFTDQTIASAINDKQKNSSLKVVSRRGGHSIVMDDGDLIGQDNLIRIRTSLGHQILMSDDGQTLMILHSNGQSYIELGKEGTIDMYSTNSVNIRTQGDLNLHADNNININAQKQINIRADEINIESEKTIKQKAGSDYNVFTQGIHTHKVSGAMSLQSGGDASMASSGSAFVNGSVINLNTGSTSTTPKDIESIPIIAQTDTLFSKEKGWAAAPGKLLTIVSRAPAHAPWANAGQGVDVKVNLTAEAQFPKAPTPTVAAANESANTTNNYPTVTVAGASTVPPTQAASQALDKSSTSALVSATAATASTNAPAAVRAGAGVVTDAAGNATGVAVGVTGLTAPALEAARTIKPGSAALVDSLVKAGKSVSQAMPSNLFTGQNGVTDLPNLVNNTTAQTTATVANLQQAQTLLTKTGLITGNEAPNAVAGPILSTSLNGVQQTVNAVKNAGAAPNTLQNNITGTVNGAIQSIASGNFAANLSQNVMSGLSGISNSVKSLTKGLGGIVDESKGLAASAFESVIKSFKSFKAGVPQNLKAINEQNQAEQANQTADENADPYAGLTQEQIDKLGNADPTDPIIRSRLGLPPLGGTQSASSVASGVSSLPGGTGAIASIVNNATNTTRLPGTAGVKSLIDNAVTGSTNNISLNSALTSAQKINSIIPGTGSIGSALGFASSLSATAESIGKSLPPQGAFDKLKSGSTDLTSLVSSGLSPSSASQLNSAIASLSSGGSVPIKIPTVAVNTNDRTSLTDAVSSVLPAGVPAPNFSGVPAQSKSTLEAQQQTTSENTQKLKELTKEYDAQNKIIDKAETEFYNAKVAYPPGDPAIKEAKVKWDAEIKKQADISKQIAQLQGFNFNLSGLPGLQQQGSQAATAGAGLERFLQTNPFTGEVGNPYQGPPSNNYSGGG